MLQKLVILALLTCLPLRATTEHRPPEQEKQVEHQTAEHLQQLAEEIGKNPTPYSMTWRSGYISVFLQAYPQHQALLLSKTGNHNMLGRRMVAIALWLADTDAARSALDILKKYDPVITSGLSHKERPDFRKLEKLYNGVEEANILDTAWGAYDAGKNREILKSFIRCAARPAPPTEGAYEYWDISGKGRTPIPKSAENLDIVSMAAKWSILSRAKQDEAFAAELKFCLQELPLSVQQEFRRPLPQYNLNESNYVADDTQE